MVKGSKERVRMRRGDGVLKKLGGGSRGICIGEIAGAVAVRSCSRALEAAQAGSGSEALAV